MTSPATRKCPLCGKPRSAEHAPFCSKGCKDRDLMRWLDDGYALPFGEAMALEHSTSSTRNAEVSGDEVEARRLAVMDRGRAQQG